MKTLCYLILAIAFISGRSSFSQSFLNGDFEQNSSSGCDYNNSDSLFNTKMSAVYAFGKGFASGEYVGETDIQTFGCLVSPQHGNWCIGLSSDTARTSDAVAIELSGNLIPGTTYKLSCFIFSNMSFAGEISNIEIGESPHDTAFGNLLYTATPVPSEWKEVFFYFTATRASKFITVRITPGKNSWNQVDNFILSFASGINPSDYDASFRIFPNPAYESIDISTTLNKESILKIYSYTGQYIRDIKVEYPACSMVVSDLPAGLYFYRRYMNNRLLNTGSFSKR